MDLDLSELVDESPVVQKKRIRRPTRVPPTGEGRMMNLFKQMYEEQEKKGTIDLKLDGMSDEGKRSLSKAMSYLSLKESDLEEDEMKVMREMNQLLSSNPKYKNLSPEELIDALNLTEEDKDAVQKGLKQMLNSAEEELSKVDMREMFPDLESSYDDLLSSIYSAVKSDPTLHQDLRSWMNSVKAKLGDDMKGMEGLSDEEFAEIALPPERLRKAMHQYTATSNRLGDLNLTAQSVKELFRMQSK